MDQSGHSGVWEGRNNNGPSSILGILTSLKVITILLYAQAQSKYRLNDEWIISKQMAKWTEWVVTCVKCKNGRKKSMLVIWNANYF